MKKKKKKKKIKTSTYYKEDENGETIEEDIKTKIHDGGFVIYQLTDEELKKKKKQKKKKLMKIPKKIIAKIIPVKEKEKKLAQNSVI